LSLTRVWKNKQLFAACNVTVKEKPILGDIVCKCTNEQGEYECWLEVIPLWCIPFGNHVSPESSEIGTLHNIQLLEKDRRQNWTALIHSPLLAELLKAVSWMVWQIACGTGTMFHLHNGPRS